MTKRAAAYVRVSSEEQTEGWSLDGQERAIRDYADRNNYDIVSVYHDDVTGSKEERPGFEQMIMDAHDKQFEGIIVFHTSRLFRNVALARRYKDLLRNKLSIDLVFINQPVVSPDDPTAFMMEGINELFDEYYLHQLRFWTSLGKQTRAQQGMWNGTLPFGYMTDPETGLPAPHPQNAQGLVMAFAAYATGRYTDGQVAELLNREGYRTTGNWGERSFTKDTVNRMLRNVFYLGLVKYKGQTFPGQHPPLIEQELFDTCQEVRATRSRHPRSFGQKKRDYVLAGIARCVECNLTLRCGSWGENGGRYYRHTAQERGYDCSVPGKYLRAEILEDQWSEIIAAIELPDDWKQRIEELAGNVERRAAILREREQVEEKLRRLRRMYQDLVIGDAEYQETQKQLQSRLAALVVPAESQLVRGGEYLENLGLLWSAATLAEQRDITRVLIKAVYVDVADAQIVALEPVPAFRILFEAFCQDLGVAIL
ncbi:recombinase family protein [Aggregatilinea lenta]|uniref:recombinase family protein n=1 Tax=Aggregatilinea lenta TaxID=913108 RepID=UPI000E5A104A|nr:recombinase family protein [Aggregatilinea lenta]